MYHTAFTCRFYPIKNSTWLPWKLLSLVSQVILHLQWLFSSKYIPWPHRWFKSNQKLCRGIHRNAGHNPHTRHGWASCPHEKSSCTSPPATLQTDGIHSYSLGLPPRIYLLKLQQGLVKRWVCRIRSASVRKDGLGDILPFCSCMSNAVHMGLLCDPIPTHDAILSVMQQLILSGLYGTCCL